MNEEQLNNSKQDSDNYADEMWEFHDCKLSRDSGCKTCDEHFDQKWRMIGKQLSDHIQTSQKGYRMVFNAITKL